MQKKDEDLGADAAEGATARSAEAVPQLSHAARDMYEALKSIVGCKAFTCDCGIPEEVFDSAEDAIAKAEGR